MLWCSGAGDTEDDDVMDEEFSLSLLNYTLLSTNGLDFFRYTCIPFFFFFFLSVSKLYNIV